MTRCAQYPEKVRYEIKADALEARRGIQAADRERNRRGKQRRSDSLGLYRCRPELGGCGGWHLGRRRSRRTGRRR